MKNLVVVLIGVFAVSTIIGCTKKKDTDETSLDGMSNGVVSENIISVMEEGAVSNSSIPVIIDNAQYVPLSSGDMAEGLETVSDKPTPKQIQQALKNAGIYKGKIDGTIGPKTKKAIEDFQAQSGLKVDGKVGPKTWKALIPYLSQTVEIDNPTAQ